MSTFSYSLLQLPELRAHHDEAIMRTYVSRDLEVEQLKEEANRQWEEWKHEAAPDLALMIQADLHQGKSEQRVGKETLRLTEASLLEAMGGIQLSDDARQTLILGVSIPEYVPGYTIFGNGFPCSRVRTQHF